MNNMANGGLGAPSTNGGEVKDITSMVKSKRKISGPQEEVNGLKKTRLSANGAPSTGEDGEAGNEQMQTGGENTEPTTTTTTEETKPAEETTNGAPAETITAQ